MRRPQIKPEHAPYLTAGNTVRIGGGVLGIAAEMTDPGGWLWSLVRATDGTSAPGQIVRQVCRRHPGASAAEVQDALDALIAEGYVEDAAAAEPTDLTAEEQERYDRGMQYYRWVDLTPRSSPWDVQRMLKRARVAMIGLGGTGATAALALAASGVGRLHCIDADIVSLSNLNRQALYTGDDLGRPKAEAAVARLRRVNSDIEISAEQTMIGSREELARACAGFDLLALCADQPDELRIWANRACLAARMRWVDGGYHGPLITAAAYTPGTGACWECLRAGERRRLGLSAVPASDVVQQLHRAPGHPATAMSAGLSGHLVAHLAVALLTGASPVTPGALVGFNLMMPGDAVTVWHPRQPDCPACGTPG
jgi:molybdopterin/thiamine biosynthesis adenylyltransferase